MPRLIENPNNAIPPDFASEEFAEARAELTNEAVDDAQAAQILANLWRITNNKDRAQWERQEEEDAAAAEEAQRLAAEENAQRQREQREEEEAAHQEERKKNKSKFNPIRDVGVPSDPVVIPDPYAVRKMAKGDYCELFYFTNNGIDEASRTVLEADPDALVMMPSQNGTNAWIPAAAVRNPKARVIKDEHLSWEEFNEAAPRMILSMRDNDWDPKRVNIATDGVMHEILSRERLCFYISRSRGVAGT
ncbi:hypothetical protein BV22DRAFT_1108578 [Leucogyrophana mollusca]|uniref:Uncharacterized protein n=1 Tax=Leucogyrophana mollusca TaxID=85980 RepID=A0ACB8AWS5_9AGAM|nr:hypothetical protein BV22DRAFT_1108578 [Leucogyrophana mollusca]